MTFDQVLVFIAFFCTVLANQNMSDVNLQQLVLQSKLTSLLVISPDPPDLSKIIESIPVKVLPSLIEDQDAKSNQDNIIVIINDETNFVLETLLHLKAKQFIDNVIFVVGSLDPIKVMDQYIVKAEHISNKLSVNVQLFFVTNSNVTQVFGQAFKRPILKVRTSRMIDNLH